MAYGKPTSKVQQRAATRDVTDAGSAFLYGRAVGGKQCALLAQISPDSSKKSVGL